MNLWLTIPNLAEITQFPLLANKILAARSLPAAYLCRMAECSQPWFPSNSAPAAASLSSNATDGSLLANAMLLPVELSRLQTSSGPFPPCQKGSPPAIFLMDCS